jgi:hypothetical protein
MNQGQEIIRQMQVFVRYVIAIDSDIRNHSNKSTLFELFKSAYYAGYFDQTAKLCLTGDALRIKLSEDGLVSRSKQNKILDDLVIMWDEWRYAWDRYIQQNPKASK